MIVLHAAFHNNQLLVRSEPDSGAGAGPRVEARAWLPAPKAHVVAPHEILARSLQGSEAVDFLASCLGKRLLEPGVLIGADLAYWAAAMKFAAGLAIRGQYLPGLTRRDGDYEARWMPAITGPDAARFEAVAKAMPPAARALTLEEAEEPPQTPAQTVLLDFTGFVIDALVRSTRPRRVFGNESIHDRWQDALAADDAVVTGTAAELDALARQIEEWQRPVRVASTVPFRLSFRLHEPQDDTDEWRVNYLLQGTKDPSLLLPATAAWSPKRSQAKALANDPAQVREYLLVSLGQAASICPNVEASLRQAAPDGFTTSSVGAHQFLRETAGALEQAGFGVMLPAWWTGRGAQARVQARAKVKGAKSSSAGLTLESLIEFNWELALGGEVMSRSELAELAKMKRPLVKVRGQWVEVDGAAIEAAIDYLKRNPGGRMSVREAMRMQIGVDTDVGPLEISGVAADGPIGDLLARLQERAPFTEHDQPAGLHASLRAYQVRGFSWIDFLTHLGLGACLADDMGLGKTIQTLAFLQRERENGERRPVLLVCPTSVVNNWQKEAARFTPELPVMIHHGSSRKRGAVFQSEAAAHALVLSSYALLQRDQETLTQVHWAGLILDEAQNIKNAATKQARAARSIGADYRIALTGTPVENNVADLWSLMEFLNPGLLGSESAFRKRFFVPIQVYSDHGASERLRRITSPFILRRLKTDKSIIADLPDKIETKVFCNLTKEQASLYEAVVKEAEAAIDAASGIERKGLVLATLLKLKQVCNHPAQFLKDDSQIRGTQRQTRAVIRDDRGDARRGRPVAGLHAVHGYGRSD